MEKLTFKGLPVKTGSPDSLTFKIDNFDIPLVRAFFKENIEDGFYLKLSLEKWRRGRTLKQNALWHKMLNVLSANLYMDMEIIKEGVKELSMREYGYPSIDNPVTSSRSPLPSHKANVKEMGILFDVTFVVAGDQNVDLSHFIQDVNDWREKNA